MELSEGYFQWWTLILAVLNLWVTDN